MSGRDAVPTLPPADEGAELDSPGAAQALLAEVRGQVYRLLALAFYEPTFQMAGDIASGSHTSVLQELFDVLGIAGAAGLGDHPQLAQTPAGLDAQSLWQALKLEHTRLFVGPGHVPAPPYESVYRQDVPVFERGLLMGRPTIHLRQQYAAAGLQLASDYTDLPDHIAAELEFMSFLCSKEAGAWRAGDEKVALGHASTQRLFLAEHLCRWVPAFCRAVAQHAQLDFYRAMGRLTQPFLDADQQSLNTRASRPGPAPAQGGEP
jgi:TorA maturation chaperone TorD